MTLDQAIKRLQELRAEYGERGGELPLVGITEYDGVFGIEWHRELDIVSVADDGEHEGPQTTPGEIDVVAFIKFEDLQDSEPEPPMLRLVKEES